MIFIVCEKCLTAIQVTGDLVEADHLVGKQSEFYPDRYRCPRCDGQATCCLAPEVDNDLREKSTILHLTPSEAYQALCGFGVPAEQTCCEEVVIPLFERAGIKVVGMRPRGKFYFRIEELTFPDGTTLFLSASSHGAVVYRVRASNPYRTAVEKANE